MNLQITSSMKAPNIFYRYIARHYADGSTAVVLLAYNMWKETPKGYWIGMGESPASVKKGHWVSKAGKKRYAYPSKAEALDNYIKRTNRRVAILEAQIQDCKVALAITKEMQK